MFNLKTKQREKIENLKKREEETVKITSEISEIESNTTIRSKPKLF